MLEVEKLLPKIVQPCESIRVSQMHNDSNISLTPKQFLLSVGLTAILLYAQRSKSNANRGREKGAYLYTCDPERFEIPTLARKVMSGREE